MSLMGRWPVGILTAYAIALAAMYFLRRTCEMSIAIVFVCLLGLIIAAVRDYGLSPTAIAVAITMPFVLGLLALGLALH